MIRLTGRLVAIAKEIKPGETMADVGTDHGFLPIELLRVGTCPQVIMADVSEKALSRARMHGEGIVGLSEHSYRVGNGLQVLMPGEVDVVVIAGMGGILMTEILASDPNKTKTFRKYIFQPRNHPEVLRYWLHQNGYRILGESLVREGKNLCEIIVAAPKPLSYPAETGQWQLGEWDVDDIRWEVPPWFGRMKDSLAAEYLNRKIQREQRVLWAYSEGTKPSHERILQLEQRIEYLSGLQLNLERGLE